uniref:Uncharacterized protein n=1 Tax=Glossina austeni TaxID=7395 RepID=A0A1A9V050_GLOAU
MKDLELLKVCIAAEISNVRLPVTILLQMICHVNGRSLFVVPFKRRIHFYNFNNGYHLDTVLLLSVFGLNRFVLLGYYGIGLLKVSTLGGFLAN